MSIRRSHQSGVRLGDGPNCCREAAAWLRSGRRRVQVGAGVQVRSGVQVGVWLPEGKKEGGGAAVGSAAVLRRGRAFPRPWCSIRNAVRRYGFREEGRTLEAASERRKKGGG